MLFRPALTPPTAQSAAPERSSASMNMESARTGIRRLRPYDSRIVHGARLQAGRRRRPRRPTTRSSRGSAGRTSTELGALLSSRCGWAASPPGKQGGRHAVREQDRRRIGVRASMRLDGIRATGRGFRRTAGTRPGRRRAGALPGDHAAGNRHLPPVGSQRHIRAGPQHERRASSIGRAATKSR